MGDRTAKGRYSIRHPEKYRGNPKECIFRSSWEYKVMHWLDTNSTVKWWASEPFPIPYISPIDGTTHRYWPDFVFCIQMKNGVERRFMIEVKPDNQTRPRRSQRERQRRISIRL